MTTLRIGYTSPQTQISKPKKGPVQHETEANLAVSHAQSVDHTLVNWQHFEQERAQVITEQNRHPGLTLYRDIAFGDMRQQLQHMVGVDLYV